MCSITFSESIKEHFWSWTISEECSKGQSLGNSILEQ